MAFKVKGGQTPLEASLDNVQHNKEETTLHVWNGAALGPQKTNQPTNQQTNKKKRGGVLGGILGFPGAF